MKKLLLVTGFYLFNPAQAPYGISTVSYCYKTFRGMDYVVISGSGEGNTGGGQFPGGIAVINLTKDSLECKALLLKFAK